MMISIQSIIQRAFLGIALVSLALDPAVAGDEADLPRLNDGSLAKTMDRYAAAVWKYFRLYDQINKQLSKGSKPLLTGLKIVAGEPVVIDPALVQSINSEKERFETLTKNLTAPELANPTEGVSAADLGSLDANTSAKALDKIEDNFIAYEKQIERFEQKQVQAARIAEQSDKAYERLNQLENILGEINSSPAGAFANALTGNKFAYLWADTATTLFDAVSGRAAAAHDLNQAYLKAITRMRANLADYRVLRSWVGFYKLQDRLAIVKTGNRDADRLLNRARENQKEGNRLGELAKDVDPPSRSQQRINELKESALADAEKTRTEVDRLWQEAERKDDKEAKRQQALAILGLAAAVANLQSARNQSNPKPSTSTSQYFYSKKEYHFNVTPPATPYNAPK